MRAGTMTPEGDPLSDPAARNRFRLGSDVLAVAGLCALFVAFFLAWLAGGSFIYRTTDGQLYADLLYHITQWASGLQGSAINPLYGFSDFFLPMGVWLNPISLPFAHFPAATAGAMSISIALAIYLAAMYIFARLIGLSPFVGFLLAQFAVLAEFPPASIGPNLGFAFLLNPNLALIVTSFVASWLVVVSLSRLRAVDIAWRAAVLTILMIYIAYLDPLWLVVMGISTLPFFAAALFGPGGRQALLSRLLCGAVVLVVLWGVGLLDYAYTLGKLTARQWFQNEIHGEMQNTRFVIFFARHEIGLAIGVLVAIGSIVAIGSSRTPLLIKIAAAGGLIQLVFISALSLIFLYANFNWTLPLPSYFEIVSWPFWIAGGLAGWTVVMSLVARRLAGTSYRFLRLSFVAAVVLAPPLAMIGKHTAVGMVAVFNGRQLFFEIPRPKSAILDALSDLTLVPGGVFHGRTATFQGVGQESIRNGVAGSLSKPRAGGNAVFATTLGLAVPIALWRYDIPTLETYSQLVTPIEYWTASRLLSRPGDQQGRNRINLSMPDARILEAFGVSYVLTDSDWADPRVNLRERQAGSNGLVVNLYALPKANVGQYSPTEIEVAKSVGDATRRMADPRFDFTKKAVLLQSHPLPERLVGAKSAQIVFRRGGLTVRVDTDGPALLILPVQFTHCFTVSGAGDPRLLRVNLLLTGLVVSQAGEYEIDETFGMFTPGCRWDDIAETKTFEFERDNWVPLPTGLHPYVDVEPTQPVAPDLVWRIPELAPIQEAMARKDWQTAVDLLDVVISRHPTLAQGYALRGEALRGLGRIEEATRDEELVAP